MSWTILLEDYNLCTVGFVPTPVTGSPPFLSAAARLTHAQLCNAEHELLDAYTYVPCVLAPIHPEMLSMRLVNTNILEQNCAEHGRGMSEILVKTS